MLTDRGRALIGVGVVAWLLSRAFGVPELAMAAVAVLVLVVLAVLYTATTSTQLRTRRHVHPRRLFFDAEGEVRIELRNLGRTPTALLQVEDAVATTLAEAPRFVVSPLRPGHGATLRYRLHARQRGRYEIGPLTIRLRDPFGIAARPRRLHSTDEVIVYPAVRYLPAGLPLGGHLGAGGGGPPRPLASGDELANVRDYVRGDDLRKVHWRSTAHRGKLMVRQDEAPQQPSAAVVLDRHAHAHAGEGPASSFESAVSAAASVAYHLSRRSFAVRLLTGPVPRPPRPLPWETVMDRLATVEPAEEATLTGLWQQLAGGIAGNGVLVAVVAVPGATELRRMVRAGRGFATRVAVLVDAGSFARRRGDGPAVDPTVQALRAADWHVTLLGHGDRLDDRWRELLVHRRGTAVAAASPGGAL